MNTKDNLKITWNNTICETSETTDLTMPKLAMLTNVIILR